MKITIRPRFLRIGSLLVLSMLLFAAIYELSGFLEPLFPRASTLMLYLTPMFFGVAVMLYVVIKDQDALLKSKTREHALLVSQERFEYLYKNSPVPYINIDDKGEIFMVNLAAVRLFDATEKKILGKNFFEHLTHKSETKLEILTHQLRNKIPLSEAEIQFMTTSGDIRWVLMYAFEDGQKGEMLVSLLDITRQKEIDIAKTEFVTLASHQLRTPIAAVRWNLELLQSSQGELTPAQSLYYFKVKRNVERLAGLVNDFLHVSKLELGTFASAPQEVNLATFIDNTLEEFEKSIEDKKITVTTSYEPSVLKAEFDPRLLRIIIDNLISNSVKYTPSGGSVTISYEAKETEVVLRVSDTGIGIPQSELGNMFNRFYRASNAEQQHAEGTGLGLYIIKQALKKMFGNVTVESELGKGTTFTLTLPI